MERLADQLLGHVRDRRSRPCRSGRRPTRRRAGGRRWRRRGQRGGPHTPGPVSCIVPNPSRCTVSAPNCNVPESSTIVPLSFSRGRRGSCELRRFRPGRSSSLPGAWSPRRSACPNPGRRRTVVERRCRRRGRREHDDAVSIPPIAHGIDTPGVFCAAQARPMIEFAIVGLGSWGLCVLERTVSRARRSGTPIRVHVVEPGQLGGGVYATEQPDYLVLNNACGQLSLYASPDERRAAPLRRRAARVGGRPGLPLGGVRVPGRHRGRADPAHRLPTPSAHGRVPGLVLRHPGGRRTAEPRDRPPLAATPSTSRRRSGVARSVLLDNGDDPQSSTTWC